MLSNLPMSASWIGLAAMIVIFTLSQLFLFWLIKSPHNRMNHAWSAIKKSPACGWLRELLTDPTQPDSPAQLMRIFWLFIFLTLFIILFVCNTFNNDFSGLNTATDYFFKTIYNPSFNDFMIHATFLGYKLVMLLTAAFIVTYLLWQGHRRTAIYFIAVIIMALTIVVCFKLLLNSPRPDNLFGSKSNSFPSNHTTLSITVLGFLAILLTPSLKDRGKMVLYLGVSLLCFAVLISRLYLHFHWLTDVTGGVLVALICLLTVSIAYYRQATPALRVLPLIALTCIALLLAGVWQHYKKYAHCIGKLEPPAVVRLEANVRAMLPHSVEKMMSTQE